jgi:hypothetical protein
MNKKTVRFFFVCMLVLLQFLHGIPPRMTYAQVGESLTSNPTAPISSSISSVPVDKLEQVTTQSGWFSILWGDSSEGMSKTIYTLTSADGQITELLLSEALAQPSGGILALNQKYVNIQGTWAVPFYNPGGANRLNITSIVPVLPLGTAAPNQNDLPVVIGAKPWVSIMCKFSDYSDEPKNLAYFQAMYANAKPGMDHYWREVSYNTANIAGSSATGWFVLPHPEIYYNPTDTMGGTNLSLLATDCIAAADASVDFSLYNGINMMYNTNFDNGYAWGGTRYMTLDGVSKVWSTTWEPPWGYQSITVIAHEMGHGFGLPHSADNFGKVYNNQWDIMADGWSNCQNSTDPIYGCMGQHTISYHKDLLGWIPTDQKYVAESGTDGVVITLEQLALPQTSNFKMIRIPIKNSGTHFYTIEARRKTGYDVKLPGEAVIIHEVNTSWPEPAHVVDIDNNQNTGDEGTMWRVGETFSDTISGISVTVLSATTTGFQVSVTNTGYTISGNAGVAGAILSYTDGTAKTATTDGSGAYSFHVSYNWSGMVTPTKNGYTFNPPSKSYTNVLANVTGQNYTAIATTYMISGNAGVAGATLAYTDGTAKTANADGSGAYSFHVSYNWSGTVTPTKPGYTFNPPSKSYTNVLANVTGQNYTAIAIIYTISGNAGIAGAILSYTDGTAKTATANSSGVYSLAVSYNWSGTVTPTKTGYTFSPPSKSYTNVLANATGQNYTAVTTTYTISGNAGVTGATLAYTDGTAKTASADGSGAYSFQVSYNWSGTVTPAKAGYTFNPLSKNYTNILANVAGENYTATAITYTISGNAGVPGAVLSYTDGALKTATANGLGVYSFPVSYNWSGTVTPAKTGYTFTPPSKNYINLTANQIDQNYVATQIIHWMYLPLLARH